MKKLASVGVFLLLATGVQAADVAGGSFGKGYVGVGAGWVAPRDVGFSGSANSGGYTANASGKFQFEDGYSLSGYAGYRFNDYLRAEAEIAHTRFDYDKVSLNGTISGNGTTYTVNGSADLEGEVSSWIGMAHGLITPMGRNRVTPLLGAGIGFAATDEKVTRIGNASANLSAEHTDLAAAGTVGVEANVSPAVGLGLRYRYFWIDSGANGVDDFTAHNLMGSAAIRF